MRTGIMNSLLHRCARWSGCRWNAVLTSSASALSLCVLLFGGYANAADLGITGKKLLLKGDGKLVILSKDPSIDPSTQFIPVCGNPDPVLILSDGATTIQYQLPCANWKDLGAPDTYKNPAAPLGPSEVKKVKITFGILKVVGKGVGFPVPTGVATITAELSQPGLQNYCMSFTGTGDGSKFLVKDATAGTCPGPAPCQATTGGFCWFLGALGASCDDTCSSNVRVCDAATTTYAGSGGTGAQCSMVMMDLGVTDAFAGDFLAADGCFDQPSIPRTGRGILTTTCAASAPPNGRRACACQ